MARYFVLVGSALAALLLIVSWCFSEPAAIFAVRPEIIATTAVIRIRSERKWPDKIEFDTSQPVIVPPAGEAVLVAAPSAPPAPTDTAGKPGFEALAQLNPDTRLTATQHPAVQIKRRLARTVRPNHVARVPVSKRLAGLDTGGSCCQFGWGNDWHAGSNAVSRKRAPPVLSAGWLALSQR